jgi:transcriptional regulator with PAS, ATPase and Fis domain
MNCGHLAPALADSQLFGSERGAYTSSVRAAAGVIEAAEGGTVFLDEIGELGADVQVKLLDFLQDRTYRRLGSTVERRSDARVLCATHRDLECMVRTGAFRADLYYRIRQVQIVLPPLRERPEDLADFVDETLRRIAHGRRLSEEALDFAKRYPWPGNVREVEQALIAAVATTAGRDIQVCDLRRVLGLAAEEHVPPAADGIPPADAPMEEIERWHIQRALVARGGNISAAARALGIDRSTVYRKTNPKR